ncbi:MAG: hypothetical protein GY953_26890 [bacterium]|nr:hypothetical protein [bacterium]
MTGALTAITRGTLPPTGSGRERAAASQQSDTFEPSTPSPDGLTDQQRQVVQRLAKTDREVRAHEQAHLAAAGAYAKGGAHYTYTTGPDGGRYAVAGEVSIDTAPVPGDPDATIRKARTIKAAAQAPVDPSAQDRQVAVAATQMEATARRELMELQKAASEAEALGAAYQRAPEAGNIISLLG